MLEIAGNLETVRSKMAGSCGRAGRSPDSVELIAVSKTFATGCVREAYEAGQLVFGESKLQESEPKIGALPARLSWHFIGRVQRNKVRKLLPLFDVIHAVDSIRLAASIDEIANELGMFPKVFLQVNIGGEASKGGFEPAELATGMKELLSLKRVEILGLMTIPPADAQAESARPWFVMLRDLRDRLEQDFQVRLPSLSMGMSSDYEIAIEEGATHVRVGSAIFGKRTHRVEGELGWNA